MKNIILSSASLYLETRINQSDGEAEAEEPLSQNSLENWRSCKSQTFWKTSRNKIEVSLLSSSWLLIVQSSFPTTSNWYQGATTQ